MLQCFYFLVSHKYFILTAVIFITLSYIESHYIQILFVIQWNLDKNSLVLIFKRKLQNWI